MLDFDALLAPVSAEAPCGPDLSYDPAFAELEILARGKPEQEFGATTIPAEEPNWARLRPNALHLLARSKDLRVGVLLTRALTVTEGVAGCAAGLALLARLVDQHWEHVHPGLDKDDKDDKDDAALRVNALAPLNDQLALLRELRAATVVRSRGAGVVTVRDIELSQGKLAPRANEVVASVGEITAKLQAVHSEDADAFAGGLALETQAQGLARILAERLGPGNAPDLALLAGLARTVAAACQAALPAAGAASPAGETPEPSPPVGPPLPPALAGEIASRADALAALDRVCAYLEQTEPANPAPLLIRRAKALMGKDFLAIMADLAPESIAQIRALAGLRGEDP